MLSGLARLFTTPVSTKSFVVVIVGMLFAITLGYAFYQNITTQSRIRQSELEAVYTNHLQDLERIKIEETNRILTEENERLLSEESVAKLVKIEEVENLYKEILSKIQRNDVAKLSTTFATDQKGDWGVKFIVGEYDALKESFTLASSTLDTDYQKYLAALAPKTTPKTTTPSTSVYGYTYKSVTNSRGTFGVYQTKMLLSEVTIKTLTANDNDCLDNCPAKSLADYVKENGGYAGMNGTYFCPPDYASCAGKTNSYDFPVYNSNISKWLNSGALSWTTIGLANFVGGTPKFYRSAGSYDKSFVTAGISNFPILLLNGAVIETESEQTAYQKLKGTRGSIGTDGTYIYLTLITNASVTDSAYVLQSLGVKDALNLDGGGSSAMYVNGSYKVGPGRLLPNAVVLIRK